MHNDNTDYSILFKEDKLISEEEYKYIQELLNDLKRTIHSLDIEQEWKRRIQEALNKLINELDRDISKYKQNMGKAIEIIDLIGYANEKALKPIQETVTKLFTEIRKVIGKENGIEIKSNLLEYKEDIENVEVTDNNLIDN